MKPGLQRRVQRYGWDKASADYERYWSRQLGPAQTRVIELAVLAPRERVLDVACGTGLVAFRAAAAIGRDGHVTGTDISQKMIDRAAETARVRGIENVSFARLDVEDLQVDVESFDVVLCALGLMYTPDPVRALSEMSRAVRHGGRVVVAVWGDRRRCGWSEIFPIVDRRVASEVCPMFFQLGGRGVLDAAMREAGLRDVCIERLATTLEYPSADEACGAAFAAGPVALAYSRFDEAARAEARVEYLASIEPYRDGAGYAIPGEFVVGRGVRKIAGCF